MARAILLLVFVLTACAGDTDDHVLRADLRTDYRPGVDFDVVRLQVGAGDLAARSDHLVDAGFDFLRGQRIGEAEALPGAVPVTVSLYRSGGFVASRTVSAFIDRDITIVTIVLTRSCEGVECPNDNPAFESCFGGRCVDPRCTPETAEFCPDDFCLADGDCAGPTCVEGSCTDGVCFARPDDARCASDERCDLMDGCVEREPVVGCDDDGECDGGTCFAAMCMPLGCVIDDTYFPDGTPRPESPCEACDAASSGSAWSARAAGTPCNDGLFCTTNDACSAGSCVGGASPCDDGVDCTTDTCDESAARCSHEAASDSCVIDGMCLAAGTVNPLNYSEVCAGEDAWSPNDTTCDDIHAGALACNGFEEDFAGGWRCFTWPPMSLSTCSLGSESYRGGQSAQTVTMSDGGQSFAQQAAFAPTASGDLYARAYLRLDGPSDPGRVTLLKLTTDSLATGVGATVNSDGALTVGFGLPWFGDASTPWAVPEGRWFCLEIHVRIAPAGLIEAFIDGGLVASATGDPTGDAPYQQVVVGQQYTDVGTAGLTVLADEIVVDTSPIGCDP